MVSDIVTETWRDAASRHTASVIEYARGLSECDTLTELRQAEDALIANYFHGDMVGPVEDEWIILAAYALKEVPEITFSVIVDTLCQKHSDYGPTNISRFAQKGVILRLNDKISRLENLLLTERVAINESLYDTYLDIIGYCVIGMMLIDGSFYISH